MTHIPCHGVLINILYSKTPQQDLHGACKLSPNDQLRTPSNQLHVRVFTANVPGVRGNPSNFNPYIPDMPTIPPSTTIMFEQRLNSSLHHQASQVEVGVGETIPGQCFLGFGGLKGQGSG